MAFVNSPERYGTVTKTLHWSVFLLFLYQYLGANLMTRIGRDGRFLGMDQNTLYDWHKSIGLVILVLMVARVVWRRSSALPDWSPSLARACYLPGLEANGRIVIYQPPREVHMGPEVEDFAFAVCFFKDDSKSPGVRCGLPNGPAERSVGRADRKRKH